jgi:anti-sigma factor RsiW
VADREPQDRIGRPSGDMHDRLDRTPHADHDLLVIAAGTDPAADPAARSAADRQSAACDECDELARDLRAISAGLQSLPRSIPAPAARDFRISPERARRLQRGNGLRRILRPFGPGGMPSLRPLSAAFTTLGVAGLLFTLVLPGMTNLGMASGAAPQAVSAPAGAGDAAASIQTTKENTGAFVPGASGRAFGSPAAPSPGSVDFRNSQTLQLAQQPQSQDTTTPTPTASVSTWSPTAVLSLVLLAVGVLLFVLRLAAYRLR